MTGRRDPLAEDIASRIAEAELRSPRLAGLTREERARAMGVGYRQLRKWTSDKAPVTPGASAIATLCRALEVTPEWLLTGRQKLPQGYADWLEHRGGCTASTSMREYMRALPLWGYDAPVEFYEAVEKAYRVGTDGLTPAQISEAARRTLYHGG